MTEEIKFAIETYPGFRFIPSDMPAKIEVTSSIYDVFKKRRIPRKKKKWLRNKCRKLTMCVNGSYSYHPDVTKYLYEFNK
jgi:hypothetical protein